MVEINSLGTYVIPKLFKMKHQVCSIWAVSKPAVQRHKDQNIHSFSSLSYDRSTAPSELSSPQSAI